MTRRTVLAIALLATSTACGARSGLPEGGDPPTPGPLSAPRECESVGTPPNDLGVVQLSAGPAHTCALLEDGTVRCWGDNETGQLGDGTFVDRPTPTDVPRLADVVQIAAGGALHCSCRFDDCVCGGGHTCALQAAGTLFCWGGGDPSEPWSLVASPTAIVGLGAVRGVVVGQYEVCVVLDDLSVRCWTPGTPELELEEFPELAGSVTVTTNMFGRCGLGSDGSVRCVPGPDTVDVPSARDGAADIAAGHAYACAWALDGSGACFGSDAAWVIGDDDIPDGLFLDWQEQPPIDCGTEWALGATHACRRTLEGRLLCWGDPHNGKLGTTPAKPQPFDGEWQRLVPTEVPGRSGVIHAAAGQRHTCALTRTDLSCWGSRSNGQLGDGTIGGDDSVEPRRVAW